MSIFLRGLNELTHIKCLEPRWMHSTRWINVRGYYITLTLAQKQQYTDLRRPRTGFNFKKLVGVSPYIRKSVYQAMTPRDSALGLVQSHSSHQALSFHHEGQSQTAPISQRQEVGGEIAQDWILSLQSPSLGKLAMSFQGELLQPSGSVWTEDQHPSPGGQRPSPGGRSSACVPTSTSMR